MAGIYTLHRDNLTERGNQPPVAVSVDKRLLTPGIYILYRDNLTERDNQPLVAVSAEKRWKAFTLYIELI